MGTWSFPGVKRPGLGVDHPSPSSTEVKEIVDLISTPLWAFVAGYRVNFKGVSACCVSSNLRKCYYLVLKEEHLIMTEVDNIQY